MLEDLDKKLERLELKKYPESCAESAESKLLIRLPGYIEAPFLVSCDQSSYGGGWTVLMRRTDGSEDFYRGWQDYKKGFGQLDNEFFLGLEKLHALTSFEAQELMVVLEDYDANVRHQHYDGFMIGPESNNFTLQTMGSNDGDAGDSFVHHRGMQFSTKDRKNDIDPSKSCAQFFRGAWWYYQCHLSALTGVYGDSSYGQGVFWQTWRGYNYSYKRAVMMIRPAAYSSKLTN
ncbi:fibrinogen C domain-containing protein 1-like isoform X2 [Drosophila biarmipes]|nr:fibrinogen C domain-containing protein 1-like isoform X2 [Drosophila biarmipes]